MRKDPVIDSMISSYQSCLCLVTKYWKSEVCLAVKLPELRLGFYFSYVTKYFSSWAKNLKLGRTGRFQRWKVVQSNEKLWTLNSSCEYRGVSGWLLTVFFTSRETFSSHQYDKLQLQLWESPDIWGWQTTENFPEWKLSNCVCPFTSTV